MKATFAYGTILLAALLLPFFVFADGPRTFKELADYIVMILDNATVVLVVLGIVIYFWGVSTNILKMGEGEVDLIRNYFLWGVIVLFVMVSVWGILKVLQNTLFGENPYSTGYQDTGSGFNAQTGSDIPDF